MPTLADIREQYPQYNDMPDAALADALHSRFYSDVPRAEFDQKIGLAAPEAPKKGMSVTEAIADIWEKPDSPVSLIGMVKGLWDSAKNLNKIATGQTYMPPPGLRREDFTDIPAPSGWGSPVAWRPGSENTGDFLGAATIPMLGAAPGGIFGGPRVGSVGSGPSRTMPAPESLLPDRAAKIVAQRLIADKVNPTTIARGALDAADVGATTVTAMDLAGANTARLAGTAYRTGGPAGEKISGTLANRAEGQGERLTQAITENLADPTIAYKTAEEIAQKRALGAKSAYNAAYAHTLDTSAPQYANIVKLMETDAGQSALKRAEQLISNEERIPKTQRLFTVDKETGQISFAKPPDTKTIDYVLRALDDVVDANKVTEGFGATKLTQLGASAQGVKAEMRQNLFDLNPQFKAARNAYATLSEMRSAIDDGMKFLSQPPEIVKAAVAAMSPAEQEMYRIGAARALQGKIGKMMPEADKTSGLRSPEFSERLRAVFPTEDSFKRTTKLIELERNQANRKREITGGSQTAERMGDDAQFAGQAIGVVKDIASFDVRSIARRGVDWYVANKLGLRDPKLADEVAKILSAEIGNPTAFGAALKRVAKEYKHLEQKGRK